MPRNTLGARFCTLILYQKIHQKERGYFPKLFKSDLCTVHNFKLQTALRGEAAHRADFNLLTPLASEETGTENDPQHRGDDDTARDAQRHLQGLHTRGGGGGIVSRHNAEHGGI